MSVGGSARSAASTALTLLACALAGCAGLQEEPLLRVVDGVHREARFVAPEAYASLLAGQLAEQDGRLDDAEDFYAQALEADPESTLAYARLGGVRCRRGTDADTVFRAAEELDGTFATLWLERARCEQHRGHGAAALTAAKRAFAEDPDNDEVNVLLAELLVAAGKRAEASSVLLGWAARVRQEAPWRRLAEHARKFGSSALATHAERWARAPMDGVAATRGRTVTEPAPTRPAGPHDRALAAFTAGKLTTARQLLDDRITLDPDDGDARALRLLVAIQQGPAALTAVLREERGLPGPRRPLSDARLRNLLDKRLPQH